MIGQSGEDLEIDGVLQLICILDQLEKFVFPISLQANLLEVLTKGGFALVAKDCPQELYKWLTEEHKALFAAILEVDLEIVLFERFAMRT